MIISEQDYKKMVTAARDNEKLKTHLKNMLSTDMAKDNRVLRKQNEEVKKNIMVLFRDLMQILEITIIW